MYLNAVFVPQLSFLYSIHSPYEEQVIMVNMATEIYPICRWILSLHFSISL